ncbi:GumC family protein [Aureimonas mangrovi]|uniref:GumC family protein n=1 Tax=Aureimonas mangrovi TaxID=2758041 RepID=UPI00163D56C1|nr:GumC family protein [Aureimonas mangrovi]
MFTSDEPRAHAARAGAASAASSGGATSLVDPAYVAGRVWRGRWFIILLSILGAALGVFIALATPNVYRAATQLIIDPRGLNLVQNEVTQTPLGLASDAALALIQSQIAVATSYGVLEQVVDRANLTQDPEFNGTAEGPFDRYIPALPFFEDETPEAGIEDRRLVTLSNLSRAVGAERSANSFVINVSVESRDPQKAADLANLVSEVFVEEQRRAQVETARDATAALTSRLAELRTRVSQAEEAVERYKAENQLVGVGGRLIDDEYIVRINEQLADIRGQIPVLRVRAESMQSTTVDDVVTGAFPEELSSQALVRLRQTYAEAQQENAVLAARLGPRHPQYIASQEALGTARRAIASELERVAAAARTELERAQQTERDLSTEITTLRQRQIETSEAFVPLRELERNADASRAVYEATLLRSREVGEQESLNTINMRTISAATRPLDPSGLSRRVIVAAGGIGGFAIGFAIVLALALYSSIRSRLTVAPTQPAFDRPVWTALPPPQHPGRRRADRANRTYRKFRAAPGAAVAASDAASPRASSGGKDADSSKGEVENADEMDKRQSAPRTVSLAQASMTAGAAARREASATDQAPNATGEAPAGEGEPTEPADAAAQERREMLRRRIREIGARRRGEALPDGTPGAVQRLAGSQRATIADIKRRRAARHDKN